MIDPVGERDGLWGINPAVTGKFRGISSLSENGISRQNLHFLKNFG